MSKIFKPFIKKTKKMDVFISLILVCGIIWFFVYLSKLSGQIATPKPVEAPNLPVEEPHTPKPIDSNEAHKINMTDKRIIEFVDYLKLKIPKSTRNNYPFKAAVSARFIETYLEGHKNPDYLQNNLQQFADAVCAFMMIDKPIKIVMMNHKFENAAGRYVELEDLAHIELSNSADYSVRQLFATISHELTHYFLLKKHNIFYVDEQNNELFTEIGAVYLGLGFYLYDGYQCFDNGQVRTEVGYITRSTIRRAIIHTAKIRKQQPLNIVNCFETPLDKGYARQQLAFQIEDYERFKQQNE